MWVYAGIIAGLMVWGIGATIFALWDAVDAERTRPVEVDADAEWAAICNATDRRDWA